MLELTGFRNCGPYLAELVSVLTQSLCAFCLTVAYILKSLPMISYNVLFQLERFLKPFKCANRRKDSLQLSPLLTMYLTHSAIKQEDTAHTLKKLWLASNQRLEFGKSFHLRKSAASIRKWQRSDVNAQIAKRVLKYSPKNV